MYHVMSLANADGIEPSENLCIHILPYSNTAEKKELYMDLRGFNPRQYFSGVRYFTSFCHLSVGEYCFSPPTTAVLQCPLLKKAGDILGE